MGQSDFQLPSDALRVLILVNPKAGRRSAARRTEQLAEALRHRGLEVAILDDLSEVADQANALNEQQKLRALVGVGGDGTAAELVNRTEPGVPVTLLAAGTANLLAKQFALPKDPDKLADVITKGNCLRIDAARANQRLFLLMAGCGFDAHVVGQVHAARASDSGGGHIRYSTYLKPILRAIRSYEYPEIRIYCDEPAGEDSHPAGEPIVARWAFVFNLPRYGWGLHLTPQADGFDGLLDVCTFGKGSLCQGLRYLAAAQLGGRHRGLSDCVIRQVRRVRITSEQPVAYQLDGDPGGRLPLEIEVLPRRLTLVVPTA